MADQILTPSYVDMDFATLRAKLVAQLQATDVFKDYDFEGSNTSLLIEFVAYMAELNTYYLNKIAKNVYDETADLYENVHRLSTFRGYSPKGYISAQTDVTVTLSLLEDDEYTYFEPGDQIYIPAWFSLTNTDGTIPFVTTRAYYGTIPPSATNAYQTTFSVKQGEVYTQTYSGADIIDGAIILPFYQFDHDDDVSDEKISVLVEIDGIPWSRIPDFYDDISGLLEINTVYTFNYNKYQRYNIEFSSSRSMPDISSTIVVTLVKSLGSVGTVGAGSITVSTPGLVYNLTKSGESWSGIIPIKNLTLTNLVSSDPGSEPQDLDTIKKAARGFLHAQYRCVSKQDYIAFLEARTDLISANAWGEQELFPNGEVKEYNRVHLSVIPTTWGSGTVATSAVSWTPFSGVTGNIIKPTAVSTVWQQTLRTYLEPRKMMNSYEYFEVPDLVYFAFDIGLRIKRSYNYIDILQDVKSKLTYYFDNLKEFGGIINYLDIHNFITDTSNVSSTNSFSNIKGINNMVFRDIVMNTTCQPYGTLTTTQLALQSNTFSVSGSGAWTKTNCTAVDSASVGPSGLTNASSITKSSSAACSVYQTVTASQASMIYKSYTFSVYIKNSTLTGDIVLNIKDGAGVSMATETITPTTSWVRYSVTGMFGVNPTANIKISIDPTSTTNGQVFYLYGAQLEMYTEATSYLESTTTSVYRYAYPQYTEAEFDSSVDNKVKSIQLGFAQYPQFDVDLCSFRQEF